MDNTKNKILNVPTLRFSEFAEKWEQRTFDETFLILSNNTLSRAELNYENGNYKNIHYGDVLIKFSAFIDVSSPDVPYINDENSSSKLDNILLQDGDIIIADTAEDFTVGKATEVENIDEIKVVSGLHTIPCHPKIKFSPRYLGYYVNSPAYHNQLIPFIQGVKVSSISKTLLKKTFISFPSLPEQTKIANFLSCLDKKIETQNKIISKYETLIKGISYYIIKKFNGKEYKLGMLAEIYQPQTITKTDLPDNGKCPVYGANGIIGYYDRFNHKESQIMITCRGSTCGTVNLSTPYSWITGNSMVINIDENKSIVDKKYLYYYLKTQSFNDLISGSGQPQIVRKPLVNLNVFLPEISQQIKLCEIIDTFEKTLKNEKEMLSALQKQKAFLLQSMFI